MFFSISMPIYNAEKYLNRSISSVMNQDEQDFELILVDDGSSDKSGEVCLEWVKKYPNKIRYVRNNNQGSLLTRRTCLAESTGEFLYIIDADDMLTDKTALSTIKKTLIEKKCDLCFFNACVDNNKSKYFSFPFSDGEVFYEEKLKLLYSQCLTTSLHNTLWNKVFSRRLVDWEDDYSEFSYLSNGTDWFQCIPIISNAKRMVYLDRIFYSYTLTNNEKSIIHVFNPAVYESLKASYQRLAVYSERWGFSESERKQMLKQKYMYIVFSSLYKASLIDDMKSRLEYIEMMGNDSCFINNYTLKGITFKRRILLFMLKHRMYFCLNHLLTLVHISGRV